MTPTARTLDLLRRCGYTADVCERWIPRANVRRDLFRCADVIACHPRDRKILLVQATTVANVSARVNKAREQSELRAWLASGGLFEVWGWFRSSGRWNVRRIAIKREELAAVDLTPRSRRGRKPVQRELFA